MVAGSKDLSILLFSFLKFFLGIQALFVLAHFMQVAIIGRSGRT